MEGHADCFRLGIPRWRDSRTTVGHPVGLRIDCTSRKHQRRALHLARWGTSWTAELCRCSVGTKSTLKPRFNLTRYALRQVGGDYKHVEGRWQAEKVVERHE